MKTVLVIDNDPSHNWFAVFSSVTFDTEIGPQAIKVEQAGWDQISIVESSLESGCKVHLEPQPDPIPGTNQKYSRDCNIDFVLIRNYPRCLHNQDFRNILFAFHFAALPSINSVESIFLATERAILYGALNKLRKTLGPEVFPFIPCHYYANIEDIGDTHLPRHYPVVVKVGSSCAGYGKMKVNSKQQLLELKSILKMGKEYFTVEHFCASQYDIRLTKVGSRMYAFKRVCEPGQWKRNVGNTKHIDLELTPWYSNILMAASKLFGGLDIVTVDLLHLEDGSEVILEINDSASGFDDRYADDDRQELAKMTATRLQKHYSANPEYSKAVRDAAVAAQEQHSEMAMQRGRAGGMSSLLNSIKSPGKRKTKKRKKKSKPSAEPVAAASTPGVSETASASAASSADPES